MHRSLGFLFSTGLLTFAMMGLPLQKGWAIDAPKVVNLWSGPAPGAKGERPEDTPRLEVYVPTANACGTAVVICPGGGYSGLALDHEGRQIAQFYNSIGVTAFVLHYRLGSQGYHHPVQLGDARRAMRWVRDHAEEYNLDRERIGITGFSAGGHLASTAATLFDDGEPNSPDQVERASSRPNFLVLGYPVISLVDKFTHNGSRDNLLGPEKGNTELARQLSSQLQVSPHTPPTFIFQTDEDGAVPAENAVSFYLALRKHKVPAEMHIYQRGPHGVGLMQGDPVLSTWGGHLKAWLRNNGWLRKVSRQSVEGTLQVNGKPVSWGSVTFWPEDPLAPVVSARVRNGKFSVKEREGVPTGRHKVEFVLSAADVPSVTSEAAPEGILRTRRVKQDSPEEYSFETKEGANTLTVDLIWPEQSAK